MARLISFSVIAYRPGQNACFLKCRHKSLKYLHKLFLIRPPVNVMISGNGLARGAAMKRRVTKRHSTRPSALRSGSGIPPEQWELSHLLKEPVSESETLMKDLESRVTIFESMRDRLNPEMPVEMFLEIVGLAEEVTRASARLNAYAYLWFSQNTKDLHARAFKAKTEEHLTALQNRMLFFELWWQAVAEQNAARLLCHSGDLRYHLESIRRYRPHTLSEPEEKIVNLKNTTGRNAINTV